MSGGGGGAAPAAGLPRIGVTQGDPAGIGPEVVVRSVTSPRVLAAARPVVLGDPFLLARAARLVGSRARVHAVLTPEGAMPSRDRIEVLPVGVLSTPLARGRATRAGGGAALAAIRGAIALCRAGRLGGMATAPVNKEGLKLAGSPHPGHTELLAEATGARSWAMMLTGPEERGWALRVVLVTIHVALARVPGLLRRAGVLDKIRLAHRELRERFGVPRPRIAVAGLNPHAGEGGLFGDEEGRLIAPAVAAARRGGIAVEGPVPPDALFARMHRREFDAAVCMYHDQGLIPLKMLHFDRGVNVTLGLPIVRTSPDHGTAYDIAWKGRASPHAMEEALVLAARLAPQGDPGSR